MRGRRKATGPAGIPKEASTRIFIIAAACYPRSRTIARSSEGLDSDAGARAGDPIGPMLSNGSRIICGRYALMKRLACVCRDSPETEWVKEQA